MELEATQMYNKRAVKLSIAAGTDKHTLNFSRAKLNKTPAATLGAAPQQAKQKKMDDRYDMLLDAIANVTLFFLTTLL